jgi:hypothetical protein
MATRFIILLATFFLLSYSTPDNTVRTRLLEFKATSKNGMVGLNWKTEYEQNLARFEVEFSRDRINYQNIGYVLATNSPTGNIYSFEHKIAYSSDLFYRLRFVDANNRWSYSDPLEVPVEKIARQFIYPNVISTGVINVIIDEPFDWLQITSMNGTVMLKQNLSGKSGRLNIPIAPTMADGMYIVQLKNLTGTITQKIIVQN